MQSSKANNGVYRGTFSGVRYEHLLAGVSGGVASTLILHPLDLLKVRFAVPDTGRITSSGVSAGAATAAVQRPHYTGLGHATSAIWRSEGVRGFYKGVTPNLWGAGAAWGLYFLFYNILKSEYQNRQRRTNLGPGTHMVAAAQAGVFTLLLTNPIWVVKTRLCLQYDNVSSSSSANNNLRYNGMLDAFNKTYKTEGIRGLYKGLVPGLFGVSHGALQFMAYEELKLSYNAHFNRPANSKLTTGEYLMCAALSKLFAAVTTYPYQVLRSRMQDQHAQYANLRACIAFTWRCEGIRGFYAGLTPYLLHVVPNICLVFLIYENIVPKED